MLIRPHPYRVFFLYFKKIKRRFSNRKTDIQCQGESQKVYITPFFSFSFICRYRLVEEGCLCYSIIYALGRFLLKNITFSVNLGKSSLTVRRYRFVLHKSLLSICLHGSTDLSARILLYKSVLSICLHGRLTTLFLSNFVGNPVHTYI